MVCLGLIGENAHISHYTDIKAMEKNVSSDCIKPVHNGNWFMWFIKKNSVNKAVWQRDKILYGQFKNRFIVHSIVQCMCRSDIIDYLIHPLGVQYNNGFLEVWPSQMVEDSPRFMSQLRASVVSPDRRIILWFKLGKYWSRGPQWQASRPEIEGNGLLCRVKKKEINEEVQNILSWPSS